MADLTNEQSRKLVHMVGGFLAAATIASGKEPTMAVCNTEMDVVLLDADLPESVLVLTESQSRRLLRAVAKRILERVGDVD